MSLGLVGSGVGLAAGLCIVDYINEIADLLGRITGQPVFDPSIYYFQKIPTIVDPFTVAWIVARGDVDCRPGQRPAGVARSQASPSGGTAIFIEQTKRSGRYEPQRLGSARSLKQFAGTAPHLSHANDFLWHTPLQPLRSTPAQMADVSDPIAYPRLRVADDTAIDPRAADGSTRGAWCAEELSQRQHQIPVLRGVDLAVQPGRVPVDRRPERLRQEHAAASARHARCARRGRSRSSKATASTICQPAGRDILRNRHFGMIFQFYHLLPELTTLENVLAPLMIGNSTWRYLRQRRPLRQQAAELLELVGLSHRAKHEPRELSGGEMQRAAIARALISRPKLLLADEPTGNLDQADRRANHGVLRRLNREQSLTIVMVTHDQAIATAADRIGPTWSTDRWPRLAVG